MMKIAIIGGGITGLTTALALSKLGFSSTVYERATELNEVGAGIWLQPNAMKVLDWLGLKDNIKAAGFELDKMEITNSQLQPFRSLKSGVVEDELGNRTISIHRGRLQKILYEAADSNTIKLGYSYQSHEEKAGKIHIQFDNGQQIQADILLGADGIHSKVRTRLFTNSILRKSNQICWRGIAPYVLPEPLFRSGKESWGKGVRFGFSQISDKEVYWFAVAKTTAVDNAQAPNRDYMQTFFKDFAPVVRDLIRHTPPSKIHIGELDDLKRIKSWYSGNCCLLGDAAHATTPNMGQGACQGMEDAYYFAHFFKEKNGNPLATFQTFEQARRKKVDSIVDTSWRFGKMAHSTWGQALLRFILKTGPEAMISRQMKEMYFIQKF